MLWRHPCALLYDVQLVGLIDEDPHASELYRQCGDGRGTSEWRDWRALEALHVDSADAAATCTSQGEHTRPRLTTWANDA